jgi:hypothetical protein
VNHPENDGWQRMATASEPRLDEMIELYESLGYMVRLEDIDLESEGEECMECYKAEPGKFKTIYVKKKEDK